MKYLKTFESLELKYLKYFEGKWEENELKFKDYLKYEGKWIIVEDFIENEIYIGQMIDMNPVDRHIRMFTQKYGEIGRYISDFDIFLPSSSQTSELMTTV